MDKIRKFRPLKNLNIRATFFIYVTIFLVLSAVMSVVTINAIDKYVSTVALYYFDTREDVDEVGRKIDENIKTAVEMIDPDYRDVNSDAVLFYARNSGVMIVLSLYFLLGIVVAAHYFYKRKLGIPLKQLKNAAGKISEKDLDFEIKYSGKDEMGRLCESFEAMRQQLVENNKETWNMIDEQKRVQRAFSHDIRTPLTITMGYVDILHEYLPEGKVSQEKLISTIECIRENLVRLENFVSTMSSMQKLSDIEPKPTQYNAKKLFEHMREDAKMICWDKTFIFNWKSDSETITTDGDILEQIISNIVSNAARFAKSAVMIDCEYADGRLDIVVHDDGNGFSDEALKRAAEPYFSDGQGDAAVHFGIGLNICKVLCEKLNGKFEYYNDNGAYVHINI